MRPKFDRFYLVFISVFHVLAILALFNFSWSSFAWFLGMYLATGLGITVGYHRLLTHLSFTTPTLVKRFFATLGAMAFEGGPLIWVAQHRLHHKESDKEMDPHNINVGFFHAHMGWIFNRLPEEFDQKTIDLFVPDLKKDSYLVWLQKYHYLVAGLVGVLLLAFGGWSVFLWGFAFRTVFTWHATWLVNSAAHVWGYRFWKHEQATNCWWVGIIALGEGWHNAHHAVPTSARHGLRWWEFDLSWLVIKFLASLGLAKKIKLPKNEALPWKKEFSPKNLEFSAGPVQ